MTQATVIPWQSKKLRQLSHALYRIMDTGECDELLFYWGELYGDGSGTDFEKYILEWDRFNRKQK